MKKYKKYCELDYKKVIAILRVLEREIEKEKQGDGYITICLSHFGDYKRSSVHHAINGFSKNKIDNMSLIYVFISLDDTDFLGFEMFEDRCIVGIDNQCSLSDEEKKIFAKIRPFKEITYHSWEKALAIFLDKIHIIIKDKLKIID